VHPNKRFFAVDGTRLAINRSVANSTPDYRLTPSGSYTDALLTTVYDIGTKVPYKWNLTGHHDERRGFTSLINHFKRGDVVVFDRGYYSDELLNQLQQRGIFYLFRLKNNSKMTRLKGVDVNIDGTSKRRVIYQFRGTPFSFLTNLGPKWSVSDLGDLYHKRWKVEEWYKTLKIRLNGQFYPQKRLDTVNKTILWQHIVNMVHRLLTWESDKGLNPMAPFQTSQYYLSLHAVEVINCIYWENEDKLIELIHFFSKFCLSRTDPGRSYERKSITDGGKWYRGKGKSKGIKVSVKVPIKIQVKILVNVPNSKGIGKGTSK